MKPALFAALLLAAAPAAAGPAEDAVAARQGFYKLLGAEMGPLAAMAKGEVTFDAERAAAHAANLSAIAGYDVSRLFIDGTSADDLAGTKAKADIWMDREDFMTKFLNMRQAINANQANIAAGRAELGGALGHIGGTCKACHDAYRAS